MNNMQLTPSFVYRPILVIFTLFFLQRIQILKYDKESLKTGLMKLSYSGIYTLSYGQIQMNKLKNKITTNKYSRYFIDSFKNIRSKFKRNDESNNPTKLHFIKDGTIVNTLSDTDLKGNKKIDVPSETYDFILFSYKDKDDDSKPTYKKLLESYDNEKDLELNLSLYRFILFEIEVNDKMIDMPLVTSEYNYYMTNNIINKDVVKYLLKTHSDLNIDDLDSLDNYNINIIDADVNTVKVPSDKAVKILDDGYEII